MDCSTIIVHTRKCYRAVIDSGAAILFIRYSTYQLTDDSFKTPIQATTTTLNTADGLPMTALGITALHLRIANFKFTHNFIICDRLQDTKIIFGIDVQKKISLSYAWDKEKNCYIQKGQQTPHIHLKLWTKSDNRKLLNQHLRYLPDIMASYQLKSKEIQSQVKPYVSLAIKNPEKARILTSTLWVEYTTSKAEQLLIFWYLIIPTNTSCLAKENTQDTWKTFMKKTIHNPMTSQMPIQQQCYHKENNVRTSGTRLIWTTSS